MAGSSRRSGSSVRGLFFSLSFPDLIVIIGDFADVFDGTMIVLAMYTLNAFHPGIYLQAEAYPSQTSSDSEGMVMEDRLKAATSYQGKAA
jgi:hypothetical protein